MSRDDLKQCFRALKSNKGKIIGLDAALTILQNEAGSGLETQDMDFLIKYITKTELRATYMVPLIKCLVPKSRVDSAAAEKMIVYWISHFKDLPVTVSTIIIQWIVGLWEYQLVDRQIINAYYDCFFYNMLKRDRLESHIARLVYLLTKPEDVTRRQVNRLLQLQSKYSKPQRHINALLSLYKSYKPELVPEKIPSMNIESIWKPIPESLRVGFEDAQARASVNDNRLQKHFDWNVAKPLGLKKGSEPLLPSVRYFHIGSTIYKDRDTKSIFDLVNFDDVGRHHLTVEMPCNATSLLANTAGYHFLTFADYAYQSRFSYNLYYTLRKAFVLERGKFSNSQMEQLLDMTIEFSRYMQEGIPVVNRFLYEYFDYMSEDYRSKFLELLQWCTSISAAEFECYIVDWIHSIFLISSVEEKCEIISTMQKLAVNLFVRHRFGRESIKPSSFLGQVPSGDLIDTIPALTTLVSDLVTSGLTIHKNHLLIMNSALDFYDEICRLESRCGVALWTIAPSALIYGGLVSKSCAILSRVCGLLLRYREMYMRITELGMKEHFTEQPGILNTYGTDFVNALWSNQLFSARHTGNFLKNLSDRVIEDLPGTVKSRDSLLSIDKHPAIMPYKYILSIGGLSIKTQEDVLNIAKIYFPAVSDIIEATMND